MTTTKNRRLFEILLRPASGSRFQPTGFPDIGAATFKRPRRGSDGELSTINCLLVESAQSMANHLEGVGWDDAVSRPVVTLEGLPWVKVSAADDGRYLTSSRTEAHRLAAGFIKDATLDGVGMKAIIKERLGLQDATPLAPRQIAAAVFALDPLCLIHGVFFAENAKVWPGQPKIARALTGFVEADDIEPVVSGGVKRDQVMHESSEGSTSKEGYGSIPFHRMEYSAGSITAYFSLDLAQLRAYGLSADATALLEAIGLWEMRSLLDGGLRLRTACDLVPVETTVVDQAGDELPQLEILSARIPELVAKCSAELGSGGPLEVQWSKPKAGSTGKDKDKEETSPEDPD